MKERPIVALVCDVIYPYSHGGRELRYQELLPRLNECAEIHVYTMRWWDEPTVCGDDSITYHAICRFLPLYTGNRRSLKQALWFAVASLRLLRCRFDVLEADHIPYFQVFALRIVATLKRKPFIVTWHEVWSRTYWREYLGWTGWVAWMTEWLAMRLPDHIIAASPETAERLNLALGGGKQVTTVPNGISLDLIRNVPASRQACDLVAVGRLIDHKRVGMLLDVVSMLHARGIRVTCRVIGDGPQRAALQQKANELQIAQAVQFRPDVSDQIELYSLVKAAKLFISLSLREGFGIAVLEAIACGVPVLTTSAPDNLSQKLVERYSRGTVCEPTADAVADAVEALLDQGQDRLPRSGGDDDPLDSDPWLADHDWAAMTEILAKVYTK